MSPARHFHPEFGYFCPSPSFRRKLRVAVACIVIGAIAGTSGVLVLKAAHDPDANRAMTFARIDDSPAGAEATSAAGQAITSGERSRPPEAAKTGCEEGASVGQTWAYLDGKCVAGRARKARTGRRAADGSAIAAAAPASGALAPANAEQAAAVASAPDRRQQGSAPASPARPADAAVSATTQPTEQPAAASKKVQKTPRNQNAGRDRNLDNMAGRDGQPRDDQTSGRAYASPDARGFWHSPFERGGPLNFFSR